MPLSFAEDRFIVIGPFHSEMTTDGSLVYNALRCSDLRLRNIGLLVALVQRGDK